MESKSCENCIHYVRYFIKLEGVLRSTRLGHCMNTKDNGQYRKPTARECYIEKDIRQEEQQQLVSAANLLKVIARHLENLTAVLEYLEKNVANN